MSRLEAWFVHAANLLVAGTGIVYAVLRYLASPADPFAVVNHPLQPLAQHAHVWTAPLVVFAAGLIWREHVWAHWRCGMRAGRRSGVALLLTLTPMAASGYLLQTAVSPAWRTAWVAVHLGASALWIGGYAAHLVARLRARAPAAAAGEEATARGVRGCRSGQPIRTRAKRRLPTFSR